MSAKLQGKLRYNGAELKLIKEWAKEANPQKAVEAFIDAAIAKFMNPQDALELLKKGTLQPLYHESSSAS